MSVVRSKAQYTVKDITDGYSVILTSDAYVFPGSPLAAIDGSQCTTQIRAYSGTEQTPCSVGNITCPIGITVINDNNSTAPTLTFTASSSFTTAGEIAIPVTITNLGITIYKYFSVSIAFSGVDGSRGTGLYTITTAPIGYSTETGGFTPAYRIALATVKNQTGLNIVLVGDTLQYSYYHYPVGYVDSNYVYLGERVSLKGQDGTTGLNNASVALYKRASTLPSAPSTNTTYTFATGTLSGTLENWQQSVPDGTDPAWMILATASSTASFDIIANSEWTEPVQVFKNGINGQPGYNQATIFLYQRKNTQPDKPSSVVTYNFTTGLLTTVPTGWSQTIPAVNGNPCWVTTAAAVSQNSTVSVASSKWADVTKFVQDGQNGAAGINSAQVVLYQRATQTPSKPSNNTTYTFSDGILSGTLGSWSQSIPSGENPVWAITASANSTATTDIISSSEWSSQVKILENGIGINGLNQATIFLYKRSATEPSKPTSTATYTFTTGALSPLPSGWTKTIPTSDGTPCWVTTSSAISSASTASVSGWSDVSKLAEDGSSVTVTSYSVKYLEGTSGTERPVGDWQNSVPSVAPGNFLWTQTIIHFSDGTATESYSVARSAVNGTSPTVSQTEVQYQQSSVGTTPPSGTWSSTPPTAEAGKYMWTRTTVTYSDNVTSVSYSVSKNGANGQDSTSYWLIVSDAAIVKTVSGVFSPTAITLTAKKQTGTAAAANYQGRLVIDTYNGSTWTNNRVNTDAATTTYSIPTGTTLVRCSLYPNGDTAHANLLDQQVVPIVIDGVDGDDAYTIILTNESHTFPGTATAAAADSPAAICRIIAYKGATQISCYAGDSASATSIATGVTGLSCAISGNNSQNVTLTFTAASTLTSGGVLQIPIVADGKSFTKVFTYSIAFKGANGISITGVTNYYLATSASSGVTTASSWGWTTGIQSIDSSKEYLWNYEVTLGSNNTTISRTSPVIIGHYGEGIDGRGISNIQEWYQVSTSGTSAPATPTTAGTGYSSTPIETSNASPYLWNYEVIYYTTGESAITDARVIGTHGTPGLGATVSTTSNGAIITDGLGNSAVVSNGVSITDVTNHYLATSVSSGVTTATSGWTTTIQSMDSTKQYLWNYEDVMGSNNQKISSTTPIIIGRYGQDGGSGSPGKGIISIVEWYQISNNNTTAPATPTTAGTNYSSTPIATTEEKPYLWNYEVINYTTGDPTVTAARVIGTQGPKGADGEDGKMIYGTSNTSSSSSTKSITCQENITELYPGLTIMSAFQNANTSTSTIYLSVASTAKPIYFAGSTVSSTNQFLWGAGSSIQFTYNGTAWLPVGHPSVYYGNSTVSAATAAKTSTINQAVICKGTTVFVDMTNKNTANSPTLNISGTGGKSIYAKGSTLSSTSVYNWTDGCTVPFTFDGANWKMGQPSESNQIVAATALAQAAKETADGKMTIWYESTGPSWSTQDERESHIGDLWIDTDDNSLHRYNGTSWVSVDNVGIQDALNAAQNAQDTADHKINTYAATLAPTSSEEDPLGEGDIWIDTDDDNRMYRWNGSSWIDVAAVVEVGGRNLFRLTAMADRSNFVSNSDTDFTKYFRYYNGNTSNHTFSEFTTGVYQDTILLNSNSNIGIAFVRLASEIDLDSSSYYTMSCWAKCTKANTTLDMGLSYRTTGNAWTWRGGTNNKPFNDINTWQYFTHTFKPDSDTLAIAYCFTVKGATNGTDTFTIRNCKLEKGSIATDWTPAPEDTDTAIATAQSAADSAQATANAATASAAAAQLTANNALTSADGKNTIYHQDNQPTGGTYKKGDTWFDTNDSFKMYTYNGTSWVAEQFGENAIHDLAISSAKISTVDVGKLTGGYIDASHINADAITIGYSTTSQMNTAISDAVDAIEIGGRNILTDSESMSSWNTAAYASITDGVASITGSTSNWSGCLNSSKYDASVYDGSEYVISFDYNSTTAVNLNIVAAGTAQPIASDSWSRTKWSSNLLSPATVPSSGGEWKRFVCPSVTLPLSRLSSGSGDVISGYLQFYNRTDNAVLQIRHIQFEKGNKATNWSPAPEDQIAYIDSSIDNIEIGGRNLIRFTDYSIYGASAYGKASGSTYTFADDRVTIGYGSELFKQPYAGQRISTIIPTGTRIICSVYVYQQTISTGNHRIYVAPLKSDNTVNWTNIKSIDTNFTGLLTWTWTTTEDTYGFVVDFDTRSATSGQMVLGRVKAELGNKATDWSPAPEDQAAYAEEVSQPNLSSYFSVTPVSNTNQYWRWTNVGLYSGYTFTDTGDGWTRIQYDNSSGTAVARVDFSPPPSALISPNESYTFLLEFRNNNSTGTASSGTDVYLVQTNDRQFWGNTATKLLESNVGTDVNTGVNLLSNYVPGTATVGVKRFVKLSEPSDSTHWTAGAGGVTGLATFTARCGIGAKIDYEMRISVYRGEYLGPYKPSDEWMSARAVDAYGLCSTAAGTAAKVVTCSNFSLYTGAKITVKFSNYSTDNVPTLNVNGTGAKDIYINNAVASSTNPILWNSNATLTFMYDGTRWVLVDKPPSYSCSCDTAESTQSKIAVVTGALVVNGTTVTIRMTKANTYVGGAVQLNFSNTGSKTIYVDNAATSSSHTLLWDANTDITFVRVGAAWFLASRSDASKVATNYITEVSSDGIFVHRNDTGYDGDQPTDNDAYGVHITDDIDIIRAGESVARYGESARVGRDNSEHILISAGNTRFYNRDNVAVGEIVSSSNDEAYITQEIEWYNSGNTYNDWTTAHLSTGLIISDTKPATITIYFDYQGNSWSTEFSLTALDTVSTVNVVANDTVIGTLEAEIANVVSANNYVLSLQFHVNTFSSMSNIRGYCRYDTDATRPYFRFGNLQYTDATSSGKYSFCTGNMCSAIGDSSFAQGDLSTAAGEASHAGGIFTNAGGRGSFAHGINLNASGDYQTVIGRYNSPNNTSAFIIGNGNSSMGGLSNALTVDWNGNVSASGGAHGAYIQATGASTISCGTSPTIVNVRNSAINYNPIDGSGTAFTITGGTPSGVTINKSGIYRISASININPTAATTNIGCYIGTANDNFVATWVYPGSTGKKEINCGPKLVNINGNTTIYLKGRNGIVDADNTSTYLLIERIA